jgi:hypothetical protein
VSPNGTGRDEQWIGKPGGKGSRGLGAQHERGAWSAAGTDSGAENDDDCVWSLQQVIGWPVSAEVTNASNAVMVASMSSVLIG